MTANRSVVAVAVCVFLISIFFFFSENLRLERFNPLTRDCPEEDEIILNTPPPNQYVAASATVGGDGAMSAGTATSGKLFSGSKIASFNPQNLHFVNHKEGSDTGKPTFEAHSIKCDYWSVVTTIFEPSDAVKRQVALDGWCIVVVGDRKGPKEYPIKAPKGNFIFLTAAQQEELAKHFPVVKALPWNHFGRKNVGFLYAILHGAKVVWDFDDDNMLLSEQSKLDIPGNPWVPGGKPDANGSSQTASNLGSNGGRTFGSLFNVFTVKGNTLQSFNPYPIMGAPSTPCWPRGLPLEHIKSSSNGTTGLTLQEAQIPTTAVGIVQSLANHDPDMDAIFRLTMPIPFDFPTGARPLVVPDGAYAPYNAQATLHLYSSLWSLLLPVTVHGRVSDIWRGYLAQRLGKDIGMKLLFSPPLVRQDRNSHNYLADFDSEGPLYKRASKLISQLEEWKPAATSLVGRIEELWVYLHERGYFAIDDVTLVQAWLHSLLAAGYQFPHLLH